MKERSDLRFSSFRTRLGWCAIAGRQDSLAGVTFGHDSQVQAIKRLLSDWTNATELQSWNADLKKRLIRFAEGEPDDFLDVEIALEQETPFTLAVIERCRHIPYGETLGYGELAADVGSPRAGRAVGNVMRSNRRPLVVPCHRVVHSDGTIGQFSAPQGKSMKERLLAMESAAQVHAMLAR